MIITVMTERLILILKKLRNKLGDKAKHIGTVIRVGYKFEE